MGIYDREYYRREGPSFLATFTERGKICKWLIGINVVVYILQIVLRTQGTEIETGRGSSIYVPGSDPVTEWFVLNTSEVMHGQVWRLLTYAFLHAPENIWHIVFNMWVLWLFGPDVEDLYGASEFLLIYLGSALIGAVAFALTNLNGASALGASAAVTGVLVLCALHYPRKMVLLFFVIPMPIWVLVVGSVVMDGFVFLSGQKTGVAVTAHLGGALFAFVYYKRHWRLFPAVAGARQWFSQRNRPALRVYREEPVERVPVTSPPTAESEEHLEAKLDRVLEKVTRFGQGSLTDSERQILMRASEIYRKRRT
jgi:membrane associated rhomboid family serine protease